MIKRHLMIIVAIMIFSGTGMVFAGEMEPWSPTPIVKPVTPPMWDSFPIQPIKPLTPTIPMKNSISDPLKDKQFSKPYMEPIISNPGQWEHKQASYMHKDIQKTITQSFPNASDIYVQKKIPHDALVLAHDALESVNTAVKVGKIVYGSPDSIGDIVDMSLSAAGVVNSVVKIAGPQTGPIKNATGMIGNSLFIAETGKQVFYDKNYNKAGIGILNYTFDKGLENAIENQNKMLMEPVTTSNYKPYQFAINDGFTKIEGKGSINVTETYIPPKTIKPFGPPDIFDGSTSKTTNIQEVTTIKTGNFNNSFQPHTYSPPIINDYKVPNYTLKFDAPRFDSSSFRVNNFDFGRIR